MAVASRSKCEIYDEDVTRYIECDAPFFVAMRRERQAVVFVATAQPGTFHLKILPPLVPSEERHRITLPEGGNRLIALKLPAQSTIGAEQTEPAALTAVSSL